jgi:hypothetical protein
MNCSTKSDILSFTAPRANYGLYEPVIRDFCSARYISGYTANDAVKYALPTHNADFAAYTEVDLYSEGARTRFFPHFPSILPGGKRVVDNHGSSFLQCGKCKSVRPFKAQVSDKGLVWMCHGVGRESISSVSHKFFLLLVETNL